MPSTVYLKDGNVLERPPEKILKEKEPDRDYLATLHYDDTPPMKPDGTELEYDNKSRNPGRKRCLEQTQNRKKNNN